MNDLDELRDDVRATAPQPRPEFAARLERRVEAGFKPVTPERAPRRINLWGPAVALGCTVLIAFVVAIGSEGNGDDDEGTAGGGEVAAQEAPSGLDEFRGSDDEGGGGGGQSQGAPPSVLAGESVAGGAAQAGSSNGSAFRVPDARERRLRGRDGNRVVVQATRLELETAADEFTEATDEVLRVADDTGSIVHSSSVSERDGKGFARYDLRVPASQLEEALSALSRIAHVTSRNASTEDITRSYVSATDRLDDARAERDALLKALEKADTDIEAEAIRRQIRLARDRIAIAQRDVEALQRRVDRARVSVTVRSTGKRSEGGAWTPGDAVGDAGRILEVAAGVVVVTAAALAPVAILALLAGLTARTRRRRRREAALDPR